MEHRQQGLTHRCACPGLSPSWPSAPSAFLVPPVILVGSTEHKVCRKRFIAPSSGKRNPRPRRDRDTPPRGRHSRALLEFREGGPRGPGGAPSSSPTWERGSQAYVLALGRALARQGRESGRGSCINIAATLGAEPFLPGGTGRRPQRRAPRLRAGPLGALNSAHRNLGVLLISRTERLSEMRAASSWEGLEDSPSAKGRGCRKWLLGACVRHGPPALSPPEAS